MMNCSQHRVQMRLDLDNQIRHELAARQCLSTTPDRARRSGPCERKAGGLWIVACAATPSTVSPNVRPRPGAHAAMTWKRAAAVRFMPCRPCPTACARTRDFQTPSFLCWNCITAWPMMQASGTPLWPRSPTASNCRAPRSCAPTSCCKPTVCSISSVGALP